MGNERRLKILLVEDNPHDATWLEHLLATTSAFPYQLLPATTLAGAIEALDTDPPHCVLLDLSLPDSQGVDSVKRMVEADPATPIVVLTGDDDNSGLDAVRSGAQDFLVKGRVSGDEVLRCVLWAVARAGVVAARGGPRRMTAVGPVAGVEGAAVAVDGEMRICEANHAFEDLIRSDRGLVGRLLTDFLPVDAVLDTFQRLKPVAQGEVEMVGLPLVIDRSSRSETHRAVAVRLSETAEPAVVMVVVGAQTA